MNKILLLLFAVCFQQTHGMQLESLTNSLERTFCQLRIMDVLKNTKANLEKSGKWSHGYLGLLPTVHEQEEEFDLAFEQELNDSLREKLMHDVRVTERIKFYDTTEKLKKQKAEAKQKIELLRKSGLAQLKQEVEQEKTRRADVAAAAAAETRRAADAEAAQRATRARVISSLNEATARVTTGARGFLRERAEELNKGEYLNSALGLVAVCALYCMSNNQALLAVGAGAVGTGLMYTENCPQICYELYDQHLLGSGDDTIQEETKGQ